MDERTANKWVHEGVTCYRKGDLELAVTCFQNALELDPSSANALHFLGMGKFQLGEIHPAEELIRQSVEINPGSPVYRYNLGQFLEGQARFDEALWAFELAYTLDPTLAAALNERGRLLRQVGREREAEASFREAIEVDPKSVEAYANLGLVLWSAGDLPGALEQFGDACRTGPYQLPGYLNRTALLIEMGRVEEGLQVAAQADYVGLSHPLLEIQKALGEQNQGKLETAADRLEVVVRDYPDQLQALYELAPLAGKLGRSFPREDVEGLLQTPTLEPRNRGLLAFALGAFLDSQKEYDSAFLSWLEGNQAQGERAQAQGLESTLTHWETLRRTFTSEVVEDLSEWGYPEVSPIFVVGTPRSGTTLVEQILASHSRVTGVGESGLVHDVLREHLLEAGEEVLAEGKSTLAPERCNELAKIYWSKLKALAPEAERVVDKTPGNAQNLGLIRALFPNARVILTRRDPLDAGLSMFSLRFTRSVDFSFDMETLGRFLWGFQNHMEHWQRILPDEFLLSVDYENLVSDPEHYVHSLLRHCDLEWEDRCLRFFETPRTVKTASQTQVRQPIYWSSVQRWSRYEQHLLPLAQAAGLEDRLPQRARQEFTSFSRLGERQWARRQTQEALASFRRALMWEPWQRGELNERLGEVLEAAERFREAEACYATALKARVNELEAQKQSELDLARSRCLRKVGAWQKARELLRRLGVSGEPWLWIEQGWHLWYKEDHSEAESWFQAVLEETEHEEAWEGWAQALIGQGRRRDLGEALEGLAARQSEREFPVRLLARLHLRNGNLDEAEDCSQKALANAPYSHQAHTLWANLLFLRDRPEMAENSLEQALTLCPDHFPAHLLKARIRLSQFDPAQALESAREACVLREDPEARLLLGKAKVQNGQEEEGLGEVDAVRGEYPHRPNLWGEEIGTLLELSRVGEAKVLVTAARQHFPEDEWLRFQELHLLRQEGARTDLLEGLHDLEPSLKRMPRVLAEFGFLYDRLGDPDQAVAYFREANEQHARRAVSRRYPKEVALSRIGRLKATMTEDWVSQWRTGLQPADWQWPPVFLVGFPRSGTTLLDQVLSSHSRIEVLEEKPVFQAVVNDLRARYGGDLKGLAEMDAAGIGEMQEHYRQVREEYRKTQGSDLVVEKMPLLSVEAGMVYRLFPEARFIFARRHPADCVLSAFMQLFAPNFGMTNFHTLEDGVRYYRAVMELWDQYRRLFPGMQVHEVRYEELLEDFDRVVGSLLDFLGLPWEEGVRNYRETALSRGRISTPSRSQVTQPLYQHARYRWRRYRSHFGSGWEDLLPFIRAADYPEQ